MTADATLTLRLPSDLRARFDAAATLYRVPRAVIVRAALDAWATGSPAALQPVPVPPGETCDAPPA